MYSSCILMEVKCVNKKKKRGGGEIGEILHLCPKELHAFRNMPSQHL